MSRGSRSVAVTVIAPLVIVGAVIVLWELAVRASGVVPQVLPAPTRVVEAGWQQRSVLIEHATSTLAVTLAGFVVSLASAWVVATAMDFSHMLRRGLMPILIASQTIPIVAIAPLMVIWFGFGLLPKMLVVALVTFFPFVIGLVDGFASAGSDASRLVRSMGAGRLTEFLRLRVPSAMPTFFTALRIGITYAVIGAIFAEYVGARMGLGIYMSVQKNAFRTDLVLAAVVVTAVLSIVLYLLTYVAERLVAPWAAQQRRSVHVA